jgi:DNA-binding MurR/RpiR family transcriptional regulator
MAQDNTVDELMQRIARDYEGLSRQLKVIANYIETNRQQMVVARIQDVADACEVQPSAVVRFAQRFGFTGYSELQALFRDAYANSAPSYEQRIRTVIEHHPAKMKSAQLGRGFIESCQAGLADLQRQFDDETFEAAVDLLQEADHIYVTGVRRMFPVAAYLGYALQHTQKRVVLLDGVGGMAREQLRGLREGDVLLAVSMTPYGAETRSAIHLALERGARVLALTDSGLSPIARQAELVLSVREAEAFGFRALSSTISLAQALFIALAYRLELNLAPPEETPEHEH